MNNPEKPDADSVDEFTREAELSQQSFVGEFIEFLATNKKWWLTPIVVVLLLLGAAVWLTGTGAAPFIYTLF